MNDNVMLSVKKVVKNIYQKTISRISLGKMKEKMDDRSEKESKSIVTGKGVTSKKEKVDENGPETIITEKRVRYTIHGQEIQTTLSELIKDNLEWSDRIFMFIFSNSPLNDSMMERTLLRAFVKAAVEEEFHLEYVKLSPTLLINSYPTGTKQEDISWNNYLKTYKPEKKLWEYFEITKRGNLKLKPELINFIREKMSSLFPEDFYF